MRGSRQEIQLRVRPPFLQSLSTARKPQATPSSCIDSNLVSHILDFGFETHDRVKTTRTSDKPLQAEAVSLYERIFALSSQVHSDNLRTRPRVNAPKIAICKCVFAEPLFFHAVMMLACRSFLCCAGSPQDSAGEEIDENSRLITPTLGEESSCVFNFAFPV